MKKIFPLLAVILIAGLVLAFPGCSSDSDVVYDNVYRFIGGAFYNFEDQPVIMGSVYFNGYDTADAEVYVNGQKLDYGIPLDYNGQTMETLPIYHKQMNFAPGDKLDVAVSAIGGDNFFTSSIVVPANVQITQPLNGSSFAPGASIPVAWNQVPDTAFYMFSYLSGADFEEVYFDITAGLNGTIPSGYTAEGEGAVAVAAFSGENLNDIFVDEDDTDEEENVEDPDEEEPTYLSKSYWFGANADSVGVLIQNEPVVDSAPEVQITDMKGKNPVALRVLKAERVTIEGIRFSRYTYDAAQITAPGKALIDIKLKKRHLAIGAVNIFDANEKEYYKWSHKRVYKRKNKTYYHNVNISPYSTVVIHTKSSDILRAVYSY